MLGLKKSEYSTIRLIHPVNIIDQDQRRRNQTVTANQSENFQKTRRHPICASIGFAVCSFETLKAVNGGSHDPVDVDGKPEFLDRSTRSNLSCNNRTTPTKTTIHTGNASSANKPQFNKRRQHPLRIRVSTSTTIP
jgi:hypothetical protein